MSESSPCFLFWPKDWLSNLKVAAMPLAAQGAYIRLLCYCWENGSVPSDVPCLARLIGEERSVVEDLRESLLSVFENHPSRPGHWRQAKLERVRRDAQARRAKKSAAGKKGAAARWRPDGNGMTGG